MKKRIFYVILSSLLLLSSGCGKITSSSEGLVVNETVNSSSKEPQEGATSDITFWLAQLNMANMASEDVGEDVDVDLIDHVDVALPQSAEVNSCSVANASSVSYIGADKRVIDIANNSKNKCFVGGTFVDKEIFDCTILVSTTNMYNGEEAYFGDVKDLFKEMKDNGSDVSCEETEKNGRKVLKCYIDSSNSFTCEIYFSVTDNFCLTLYVTGETGIKTRDYTFDDIFDYFIDSVKI